MRSRFELSRRAFAVTAIILLALFVVPMTGCGKKKPPRAKTPKKAPATAPAESPADPVVLPEEQEQEELEAEELPAEDEEDESDEEDDGEELEEDEPLPEPIGDGPEGL